MNLGQNAKKLAGLQKTCTFVLSLKFFIEEQLSEICVENKLGAGSTGNHETSNQIQNPADFGFAQ